MDVYEGSPSSITLYMLVVPKLSFLIIFIHFFVIFANFLIGIYAQLYMCILPFLEYFPIISTPFGFIMAVIQKDFRNIITMFAGPIGIKIVSNRFAIASGIASFVAYWNNPNSYLPFMVKNVAKSVNKGSGLQTAVIQSSKTRRDFLAEKAAKIDRLQAANLEDAQKSATAYSGYNELQHTNSLKNAVTDNPSVTYASEGDNTLKYGVPEGITFPDIVDGAVTLDTPAIPVKGDTPIYKPNTDYTEIL